MALKVEQVRAQTRKPVNFYAIAAAAGSTGTETAVSLTKSRSTEATAAANSHTIPSGKTLAITMIQFQHVGHATATTAATTWNVRVNTGGAVTTSSTPIIESARTSTPATTGAVDRVQLFFDPPIEIAGDGTKAIGVTAASTYTTNAPTWDVNIIGYEF